MIQKNRSGKDNEARHVFIINNSTCDPLGPTAGDALSHMNNSRLRIAMYDDVRQFIRKRRFSVSCCIDLLKSLHRRILHITLDILAEIINEDVIIFVCS